LKNIALRIANHIHNRNQSRGLCDSISGYDVNETYKYFIELSWLIFFIVFLNYDIQKENENGILFLAITIFIFGYNQKIKMGRI
jgi:hypothetical protein